MSNSLFTIGHSTHSLDRFIELLRLHEINAIVDVRSSPFSRNCPHFCKDPLKDALKADAIAYVFLGKELGA